MSQTAKIDELLAIMARLRDPKGGCPWDLQQTFLTILPYTLEEAYEVAEAIEDDDMDALRDELGDLLLQVVFHARMAEERGAFDFGDVVERIADKLLRRHPHVFGDTPLHTEAEVRANWEQTKAAERADRGDRSPAGALGGVARTLPALVRAEKLQRRAARVGFDWAEIDGVLDKVAEELGECRESLDAQAEPAERVHEVGDLLFSCVNLARHMGVDAEQALRAASHRFEQRFGRVERALQARGQVPSASLRAEMDRQWEQAKAEER